MKKNLYTYLAGNEYPGRGICIGRSPDGTKAMIAYWIMGRSANSRNRVFAEEPDGIRTQAADPARMEDPSLIIYHPVRQMGRGLIVTNGDQTDTIRDFLEKGLPFEQALRTGDRLKLGMTAPACGLELTEVFYHDKDLNGEN